MNEVTQKLSVDVTATAAVRLRPRFRNKPGLVKVSLQNLQQIVLILRNILSKLMICSTYTLYFSYYVVKVP